MKKPNVDAISKKQSRVLCTAAVSPVEALLARISLKLI
jgi:hypothetical protein